MLAWLAFDKTGPRPWIMLLNWQTATLLHPFLDNRLLASVSIRCQETVVPPPADDITLTYVCVWTLVGAGAGEGDEFMAPFVDHKTADCGEKEGGERG